MSQFPCKRCGAKGYHREYGETCWTCKDCGSRYKVSIKQASAGAAIQVFKPIVDENIDGVPREFTSKRAHVDALNRAGLTNKHYENVGAIHEV